MTALTAKAALVDPATIEDAGQAITTRIPRSQVEEAVRADGPTELFLDVAKMRDGDREAEQRITVSWDTAELEQLLSSTPGDDVVFAFKPDELVRMFDEDVEGHGMRERLAVLTIAATAAAGISAGVANAMVANPISEGGGGGSANAAFVTDSTSSGPAAEAATASSFVTDTTSSGAQAAEAGSGGQFLTDTTSSGAQATEAGSGGQFLTDTTSSGPQTSPGGQFLTDATSSGPGATTEAATASGGQSFVESTGGEVALAGGLALLILGAGFLGTRQRGGVQPA